MVVKGISIQDIHFGIKESKRLYEELSFFKEYLSKSEDITFLNINGDFFDRKLSLNEPASFYAVSFFDELVNICKEKKIKIRVLQGTRSHDLNQLSIFSHYLQDSELDLKIFETVTEEEYEGLKFLYVPEEYPENVGEYYAEYKTRKYNIIHGHGTWDFVSFKNQIELSETNGINTAPVFIYSDWKDALENGVAIFGHIHGRNTYKKKIFYSGAYSRWGYGEISERGFTIYEIDTENGNIKVEFVNNDLAPTYNTFILKDEFEDLEKTSVEDLKVFIDEALNISDNIRIDFAGISEDKLLVLKETYKNNSKIKIEVREKKTLLEDKKEEASYNKYNYILKRELPMDETIKKFIKEDYGKEIDIEYIRKILCEEQK